MNQTSSILFELQYLPSVQYFSKFCIYEKVWIEQHENYIKGTYRNRCHIVSSNGLLRLSVPLMKGKNEQQNIREVKICNKQPWLKQHWKGIKAAYGKSPYFIHYADELAPFFEKKYESLFDLNWALLQSLLKILKIECQINFTESYEKNIGENILDFRNGIHPNKSKEKKDEQFVIRKYPQVFEDKNGFTPNLSVLDLLFCTGPQASLILENH